MKTQIMLDLETLGNKPGSVIVAIGAVKFGNGEILDSFYERVDAESCVSLGLRMDVSTVLWWMKQNDDARKEITKPGGKLSEVLMRFAAWVNDLDAEVWGNGASFDNVLLSDAYDRAQLPRPWKYYNDRCYRTVKNLRPEVPMIRGGTHHNALDDAKSQATHLMALIQGTPKVSREAGEKKSMKTKPTRPPAELAAPPGSPVVEWQKGILRVHDKDDLDCTDVHILTIDGRIVLRAIVPVHGLGDPVGDADRKLIGQALAEYLANR